MAQTTRLMVGLTVMAMAGCGGGHAQRDASGADDAGPIVDAGRVDDASAAIDAGVANDAHVPEMDSSAASGSPAGPGPYAVDSSRSAIDGASAVAFVPRLPAGTRAPLVALKHGFQLATSNYAQLAERIASHGFVVVGVDTASGFFGGPTNADERDATVAAIDFALSDAPFAALVDGDRVAVVGHSRGGKVAVMVAAADARVGAALLLDPVNRCGPGASYSASCPDVTSASLAGALAMPVGVMGETNNASGGFMPCAPADQNYQTIYDALSSSPWAVEWTFTGADHMDFTDDGGGSVGGFCPDGPGDDAQIREAVRTMSVAFVRLHLRGETSMAEWLTGASLQSGIERDGP